MRSDPLSSPSTASPDASTSPAVLAENASAAAPLLTVRGLKTQFFTDDGTVSAVDGIDLEVRRGETLGLVGESGCGKSVTGFSLMRLVAPPGKIVAGQVILDGVDLLTLSDREMRKRRGEKLAMVFQEPMTSLDPLYPARDPLIEAIRAHQKVGKREARGQAVDLLASVGIHDPDRRAFSYPHELSGGMRQRVMIAAAIACRPALLIADEPTTALDVTVQAQILALLQTLQQETKMSVLLITHNLGVVAENCDRLAVMYSGKIVETGATETVFGNPRHPYTQGLLRAAPRLDMPPRQPLPAIPGVVPDPLERPSGCRFRDRCVFAMERCAREEPPLLQLEDGHHSACWVLPPMNAPVPTGELPTTDKSSEQSGPGKGASQDGASQDGASQGRRNG